MKKLSTTAILAGTISMSLVSYSYASPILEPNTDTWVGKYFCSGDQVELRVETFRAAKSIQKDTDTLETYARLWFEYPSGCKGRFLVKVKADFNKGVTTHTPVPNTMKTQNCPTNIGTFGHEGTYNVDEAFPVGAGNPGNTDTYVGVINNAACTTIDYQEW